MQFSLKHSLLYLALIASIVALLVNRIESSRQKAKIDQIEHLLPSESVIVDLLFKTERSQWNGTLRYPGTQDDRGCIHSVGGSTNGKSLPGIAVSAWFVGDIELMAGFGKERIETAGHLIAVQVSIYDSDTGAPTDTTTEFVVYTGEKVVAIKTEAVSVTLMPPAN